MHSYTHKYARTYMRALAHIHISVHTGIQTLSPTQTPRKYASVQEYFKYLSIVETTNTNRYGPTIMP